MRRERDIKLDEYEITKFVFRELRNICLQYPENIAKLNCLYGLSASPIGGMPKGNNVSNPTEKKAMRAATLSSECKLIEDTVLEVLEDKPGLYPWLLKSVTEEHATWEKLGPPCGKNQFYTARRRVFYLLALKKGKV